MYRNTAWYKSSLGQMLREDSQDARKERPDVDLDDVLGASQAPLSDRVRKQTLPLCQAQWLQAEHLVEPTS